MAISAKQRIEREIGAASERRAIIADIRRLVRFQRRSTADLIRDYPVTTDWYAVLLVAIGNIQMRGNRD